MGTGLGADHDTWTRHHAISDSTFSGVSFVAGHVDGFTIHLGGDGLTEASAGAEAVKQLPTDARLVFERRKYIGMTDPDDQCDLVQYQSTELGNVIPHDPTGVILIQLGRVTDDGLQPYDSNHVTTISILATGTLNDVPNEC